MNKYVPKGAHWHSLMVYDMDKPQGTRGILPARATIEEARGLLADMLSEQQSDADQTVTPEARAGLYAEMREGKWDYMSDDEFCIAIYPCTGDGDKECKEVGDLVTVRLIRMQRLSSALCPCPEHTAARLGTQASSDLAGLAGLLAAAAMFTTGDNPQTGMYM